MPVSNIAHRTKFFFLDGFIAAPLLLVMIHPRKSTLIFLGFVSIVLFILERRGMNLLMLGRKIRCSFIGRERDIRPWWRKKM